MGIFYACRLGFTISLASLFALAACSGGGASPSAPAGGPGATPTIPPTGTPTSPPTASSATTAGIWKGTFSSTTTSQVAGIMGLVAPDGHSLWMTTDGRVFDGSMPLTGDRFETQLTAHMYDGGHFPDGTNHGTSAMLFDSHTDSVMSGRFNGAGDSGVFNVSASPMWNRSGSLTEVAGVFTRTVSDGYAMTMTISANGQLHATDTRGCVVDGTATIPDPTHNFYRLAATVTSCGALDGVYAGMGTLLDADAMTDWMTSMIPFHHGTGGMHGGPMMGHNTIPSGQRNLFMFSLANDRNAFTDALAR